MHPVAGEPAPAIRFVTEVSGEPQGRHLEVRGNAEVLDSEDEALSEKSGHRCGHLVSIRSFNHMSASMRARLQSCELDCYQVALLENPPITTIQPPIGY